MPILDWENESAWLSAIGAYACDVLKSEVREHVRKSRSYCDSDDQSWLPDAGVQPAFTEAFTNYYKGIRAFHGCRPLNVETYIQDGLFGHDSERLKREFLQRFPSVPEAVVREAAKELDLARQSEIQKTWFVLTEKELIERFGSYVVHGSEYLAVLARNVCLHMRDIDYFEALQKNGYPTIIEVELPTQYLPAPQVEAIAKEVLSAWGAKITRRSTSPPAVPSVSIRQPLEPRYIAGHTHPNEVRDPYRMTRRLMSPTKCPACIAGSGPPSAYAEFQH